MSQHLQRREFLRRALAAGTATMTAGGLTLPTPPWRPALPTKS